MVIHLENTCTAYATMMTTIRLILATPFAMPSLTTFLGLVQAKRVHHGFLFRTKIRVMPMGIVIRNFAWMLENAPHVAKHEHESEHVKSDSLRYTSRPSLIISVVLRNIKLQHRNAMEDDVDEVQCRDGETYEADR